MSYALEETIEAKAGHTWLRKITLAHVAGPATGLLDETLRGVLATFQAHGHIVQDHLTDRTDAIITTARVDEPVDWRAAPMFVARKRFKLMSNPMVFTFMHMSSMQFQNTLDRLQTALDRSSIDPLDYNFPGLAPEAYHVLIEQGKRGGPILALLRILQAQAKCFRILLVVGDDKPEKVYHFDLVGAHPVSEAASLERLYDDIVLRMATTVSTRELDEHLVLPERISRSQWEGLTTPAEMSHAARELGRRGFFTETVEIAKLVQVPVVPGVVAKQYSEGCFATWDATLGALITTATGSVRPIYKGSISEEDLAVIAGVRSDGRGVLIREVEGKSNVAPSSEAFELADMDAALPTVTVRTASGLETHVPVVRSKLHGHRSIGAYDPRHVEFVAMDPSYYHYLVSCATEAQAYGVRAAFARSVALQNPQDLRQVVFTILPGHGVVIVEKWVPRTSAFDTILKHMDAGYLRIESHIPQGPMQYAPNIK